MGDVQSVVAQSTGTEEALGGLGISPAQRGRRYIYQRLRGTLQLDAEVEWPPPALVLLPCAANEARPVYTDATRMPPPSLRLCRNGAIPCGLLLLATTLLLQPVPFRM